jgi:metallo-beta-lactamase family protein
MNSFASLHFMGAAGEVTGSKTLVHFDHQSFLVDYGMFQGEKTSKQKNWEPFGVGGKDLTAILLTHAHMDHSGLVPRLVNEGFRGNIFCSPGTAALLKIMLTDSAHLQMEDAEYANRTGHSHHKPALVLYDEQDVANTLRHLQVMSLNEWHQLGDHVSFQMLRAGHITGSTFIRFKFMVDGKPTFVTFSGDIGHNRQLTVREPDHLPETDYLVLESTYGDRLHPEEKPMEHLAKAIHQVIQNKGVLVIPAFAVGRAQELIYMIRLLEDQKLIPSIPVILDSPMSKEATAVYLEHSDDFPEEVTYATNLRKFFPIKFEMIKTGQQSMEIVDRRGPMVIISASGMLEGGRVLHHLKNYLPSEKNTVLFVGYQAEGTKGRYLQEKAKSMGSMLIHHQEVKVRAQIETLPSLSGHGDQEDLFQWILRSPRKPKKIFINHGTPHAMQAFAARIEKELGVPCEAILEPRKVEI